MYSKIAVFKSQPHIPGSNELIELKNPEELVVLIAGAE